MSDNYYIEVYDSFGFCLNPLEEDFGETDFEKTQTDLNREILEGRIPDGDVK